MANKRIPLNAGKFYHIYNHAVHQNNLFLSDKDYHLFLARLSDYISQIADMYSYCLMPNHYHLLVHIKDIRTLQTFFGLKEEDVELPDFHISDKLTHQIGSFQNSYAKAINTKYSRRGALFMQSFGRRLVTNEAYLYKLVHYIHYNPVHHGFVDNLADWAYSSYKDGLTHQHIIALFGGEENYRKFHEKTPDSRLCEVMEGEEQSCCASQNETLQELH